MNKIYKVVWNRAKHCYTVASELAKGVTKGASTGRSVRAAAAAVAVAALFTAMPFGATYAEDATGVSAAGQSYTRSSTGSSASFGPTSRVNGAQVVDTVSNAQYILYNSNNNSTQIYSKNKVNNGRNQAGIATFGPNGDVFISQQKENEAQTTTQISGNQVTTGSVVAQTKSSGYVQSQVTLDGNGITFGKDEATAKKLTADTVVVQDDIKDIKEAVGDENSGLQKDVKDLQAKTAVITNNDTDHTTTIRNDGKDADYGSSVKISDKEVSTSTYQYDRANEAAETTSTTYTDGGVKTTASYVPGVGSKLEKVNTTGEVSVQNDGVSISQRTYDQKTYKTDTSKMEVNADGTTFSKTADGQTSSTSISGDTVTTGSLKDATGATVSVSDIGKAVNAVNGAEGGVASKTEQDALSKTVTTVENNTKSITRGTKQGIDFSGGFPAPKEYTSTEVTEGNYLADGSSVQVRDKGEGVSILTGDSKLRVTNADGTTFTQGNGADATQTKIKGDTVTTGTLKSANGAGVAVSDIESAVTAVKDTANGLSTKASQADLDALGTRVTTVEGTATNLQNRTQALEDKTQGVVHQKGYSGDFPNLKEFDYTALQEGNPNEDGSSVVAKGSGEGVALIAGDTKVNVKTGEGTTFTTGDKTTTINGDQVTTGTVSAGTITDGTNSFNATDVKNLQDQTQALQDKTQGVERGTGYSGTIDNLKSYSYTGLREGNPNEEGSAVVAKGNNEGVALIAGDTKVNVQTGVGTTFTKDGKTTTVAGDAVTTGTVTAKDGLVDSTTSDSDIVKGTNTVGKNVTNLDVALHDEIAKRISADEAQDKVIQQVNQNLADNVTILNNQDALEAATRDAADKALQQNKANKDLDNLSDAGKNVIKTTKVDNAHVADVAGTAGMAVMDSQGNVIKDWYATKNELNDASQKAADLSNLSEKGKDVIANTTVKNAEHAAQADQAQEAQNANRAFGIAWNEPDGNGNNTTHEVAGTVVHNAVDQVLGAEDENGQRSGGLVDKVQNLQDNSANKDLTNLSDTGKANLANTIKTTKVDNAAKADEATEADHAYYIGHKNTDGSWNEVSGAQVVNAYDEVYGKVNQETGEREGGLVKKANDNADAIAQEVKDRQAADTALDGKVTTAQNTANQAKAGVNYLTQTTGGIGRKVAGDTTTTYIEADHSGTDYTGGTSFDNKGNVNASGTVTAEQGLKDSTTSDSVLVTKYDDKGNVTERGTISKDTTVGHNVDVLAAAQEAERNARIFADKAQDKVIQQVNQNLADNVKALNNQDALEAATRAAADAQLQTNIDNEAQARKDADAAEAKARQAGDNGTLKLDTDGTLQQQTVAEDGTYNTTNVGKVVIGKDGDNQVTISENGIKVGKNSGVFDKDGFYAGGDTYDAAAAAISADGKIKGANGNFTVNEKGDVTTTGDVNTKNVNATGDVNAQNINAKGDVNTKNLNATGDAKVAGKTTTGSLEVTNDATVGKDLSVAGTTTTKDLKVTNDADIAGNATVGKDLSVKGNANVDGSFSAGNKQFQVQKDGSFKTTDSNGNNTFSVNSTTGEVLAHGNINSDGTIKGKEITDGAGASMTNGTVTGRTLSDGAGTTIASGKVTTQTVETDNLKVKQNASIDGNASIGGTLTAGAGNFNVDTKGDVTTSGDINSKGTIKGATITDGTAKLQNGDLTGVNNIEAKTITTTGDVKIGGKTTTDSLEVNKDATVGGDLDVKGNATVEKDLTVKGKLNVGEINMDHHGTDAATGNTYDNHTNITADGISQKTSVTDNQGNKKESQFSKTADGTFNWASKDVAPGVVQKTTSNITADGTATTVQEGKDQKSTFTQGLESISSGVQKDDNNKSSITQKVDRVVSEVKAGDNSTKVEQGTTDVTTTAKQGTITNDAKNITNTASETLSNKAKTILNESTGDTTNTVGGNLTNKVNGNQEDTIGGTKTTTVTGLTTENYNGGLDTNVTGTENHKVTGVKNETVTGAVTENYGSQDTTVNGDQKLDVKGSQTNTIGGNQTTTVTGDSSLSAKNISNTAAETLANKAKDITNTADSDIVNKAGNKISNEALDIENTAKSSIKDTVANDYGSNVTTKTSDQTLQNLKNEDGSTASYLNGVREQKATLAKDGKTTTIDTVAGQTNTNITDGKNVTNNLQKADELAGSVTDGQSINAYSNKAGSFGQTIAAGDKQNAVAKTVDQTISLVTDGTNQTSTVQTATDLTNTAEQGTITNKAKNLVNDISGDKTDTVKGAVTENYGSQTTTVENDQSTTVKGNQSNDVLGNQSNTVKGNKTDSVTGDVNEDYGSLDTTVHGDQVTTVEKNQTNTVKGNKSESVTGDVNENYGSQETTIEKNQVTTVKGNQTNTVNGNKTDSVTGDVNEDYGSLDTTVHGDQVTTVEKNQTNTVKGNKAETVDGAVTETYGSQDTTVNGAQKLHVTGDQTNTIDGAKTTTVTGKTTENYNGGLETTVSGEEKHTVNGAKTENVTGAVTETYGSQDTTVNGAQKLHVTGDQTNTIDGSQTTTVTGDSSLTAANITNTTAGTLTNNAGAKVDNVTGAVTETYGSQKTTVNGAKETEVNGLTTERYNAGLNTTVTGDEQHSVTGKQTNKIDGDQENTIGGNQKTTVTGDSSLSAKNINNTATEKLTNSAADIENTAANTITNTAGTSITDKVGTTTRTTTASQIEDKVGGTTITTTDGKTKLTNADDNHHTEMDFADVLKDLGVRGNASVGKDLSVAGNTTLGAADKDTTLTVNSTSTFKKAATFKDGATVEKGLNVTGGTTTDTLHVTNTSEFEGAATFHDNVTVDKDLSVGGNATVAKNLNVGGDVTANSYKVGDKTYIDADGLKGNDQKISNVKAGEISATSKDVVVGSQLHETNMRVDNLDRKVNNLDNRVDKVGASAAAMANLHPLEFDPDSKWNIAAAVGNYRSSTATAVGAFYRPNEDVQFNVSTSFGNGENMVGGGVSLRLGHGGNKVRTQDAKDLKAENQELRARVDNLTARMDALLSIINPAMSKEFPDVPANHWAYEAVSKLAGNGIVEGFEDGKFHGEETMTRYQMAEIIYNALAKGAKAEQKLVEEFKPELQAMAAQKQAGNQK